MEQQDLKCGGQRCDMVVEIYNDDKRQKSVSDLSASPLLGGSGGQKTGHMVGCHPSEGRQHRQAGTPIMFGGHLHPAKARASGEPVSH